MMEGQPKNQEQQNESTGNTVEKVVEKLGEKAGGFLAKQALNYATAGIVGLASVGDALAKPDSNSAVENHESIQETAQVQMETPKADLEVPRKKGVSIEDVSSLTFETHPEVVYSEETRKSLEEMVSILDEKVLDFKYQVDKKKEDVERDLDTALLEMNTCISGINEKGDSSLSRECGTQVEQVRELLSEYKAGQVDNSVLVSRLLHVRQFMHQYFDTYNQNREAWLQQGSSQNTNK